MEKLPNLRHLRAFKEVSDLKNVSAAAGRVHLSQPAVTQAIGGLERSLGLTLFDRRPEGMFVTPSGRVFLNRVRRLLVHLEGGAAMAMKSAASRTRQSDSAFFRNVSASQMRALIAVWETGSFTLAARRAGVSQPSIHRAARDLEGLAGIPFFHATQKGVELTPAAEQFARGIKLAGAELKQGHDEIALAKGTDSIRIVIGSMPLSRTHILPSAINSLVSETLRVQIRTIDGPYDELLRSLRYGDLDFLVGALRDPLPADEVVQEHLFDDSLAVAVGAGHPLAGQDNVTLEETLSYPWIAPPKSTPAGSYLFRTVRIEELETTPVRAVSSSLVLVRGLLMQGDYVTIMSRRQMAVELEQGILVPLNVPLPDNLRPIGLTYRKNWHPTPTQRRLLDLIREASSSSEQKQLNT